MTMGPEPIRRIFSRSVRFGTRHYPSIWPEPIRRIFLRSVRLGTLCLALDLPVHDGGLGNRLLALVEHVVDAPRAEPHRLAVAPELLPEHAHALLHALLDGVGFQRQLALTGECGPLGLLAGLLGLPVRDQVFRHLNQPPSLPSMSETNRWN